MRADRRVPVGALAVAALLALFGAGCSEDGPVNPNEPPDTYIKASTPINGVRRVMATYSAKDTTFYLKNMTNDFRFEFSPLSDPDLVAAYGTNWSLAFERISTQHLYEGFTDLAQNEQPAAVRIDSDFLAASVIEDPEHTDSLSHYQIVSVPTLAIVWTFEGTPNDVVAIESNYGFRMVRGDAAVLRAGQERDSTVWYVRRIEDHSTPGGAAADPRPATRSSGPNWGTIRAQYLF
jgi:hypothetical protein